MGSAVSESRNEPETAKLAALIRGKIVPRLREAYDALDLSPVPNDQIELLLALRHKERERKRKG
jgi:hypothetical protein